MVWPKRRERRGRKVCQNVMTLLSVASLKTIVMSGSIWHLLLIKSFGKNVHPTSHPCSKGVVEASVNMQRDRKCILRVHPSQVSFQFLRWIRGKWLIYRLDVLEEGGRMCERIEKKCFCVCKIWKYYRNLVYLLLFWFLFRPCHYYSSLHNNKFLFAFFASSLPWYIFWKKSSSSFLCCLKLFIILYVYL